MKKPSLKDKLLSASSIEEAHRKLTQPTSHPVPAPAETAQPPEPEAKKTPEKPPIYQSRNAAPRRGARNTAEAYPERNIRITIDMPETLHERVKLHTVLQKQSIREFVLTLVERELARK